MPDPIYGHELLEILTGFPQGTSREQLKSLALARFGTEAVYTNCSGMRFDFDGVVEFLASRGKLSIEGDTLRCAVVPSCGHAH